MYTWSKTEGPHGVVVTKKNVCRTHGHRLTCMDPLFADKTSFTKGTIRTARKRGGVAKPTPRKAKRTHIPPDFPPEDFDEVSILREKNNREDAPQKASCTPKQNLSLRCPTQPTAFNRLCVENVRYSIHVCKKKRYSNHSFLTASKLSDSDPSQ